MLVAAKTRTSTLTVVAAAQTGELAVLQNLQQLGLQRRRHLADFVQQQRAFVAQLEFARLGFVGAGKRARLVTKQLALQQFAGHRRAVDLQEGAMRAIGILVDQMRQNFFAGAAFAQQQDREIEARHLHRMSAQLPHLRRGREEVNSFAHFDGFARARSARLGVFHAEAQNLVHLFFLHRLGKVVLRAQAHGLRYFAGIAHARQHHDFGRRPSLANALQGFQAIGARHHHVEQHQVGSFPLYFFDGFQSVGSGGDAIGIQLQNCLEIAQHTRFVVHHENVASAHCSSATRFWVGFSNTRKENLLPAPGSLSTQIFPPADCTRRRAMARPSP